MKHNQHTTTNKTEVKRKAPNYTARRIGAVAVAGTLLFGAYKGFEAVANYFKTEPVKELSQVYKNGDHVKIIENLVLDGSSIDQGQSVNIEQIQPHLNSDGQFVNDPVAQINRGDTIKSTWAIDIPNGPKIQNADGSVSNQELVMFYGDVNGTNGYYYVDVYSLGSVGGFKLESGTRTGIVENNNVVVNGKSLPMPVTTFNVTSSNIK